MILDLRFALTTALNVFLKNKLSQSLARLLPGQEGFHLVDHHYDDGGDDCDDVHCDDGDDDGDDVHYDDGESPLVMRRRLIHSDHCCV